MPTFTHEVMLDLDADTVFAATGTVGALVGRTVDSLVGTTVDALSTLLSREDVSRDALRDPGPGISAERGRDRIAVQSPPLANETTLALNNARGDYSPTNAASPLYPDVATGLALRWRLDAGSGLVPIGHGFVTELVPRSEVGADWVELTALSQLARLVGVDGKSSPLYGDGTQANGIRTDEALALVLDAAGLADTSLRDLDAGDTILNWFVIRPDDVLFDLAVKIWASEGAGARLYDAADGKTTFKRRTAEALEARTTTVQATFRDTDDGTDPWYTAWDPASGRDNLVNSCTMTHVRRAIDAADAVFWSFGATVVLGANEARPFQVTPTSDDPIASVVALAAGTDYTVSVGSLASAAFDRTSGPFVTLTLTAGAGGATLTGLQVRGKLARVAATTEVGDQGIDATDSIRRFGPHPFQPPTLGELDYAVMQAMCNAHVARGMLPRATALVDVPLVTDAQVAAALGREVGDRIAVVNARSSFSQAMWVEYVKVVVEPSGAPRVLLGCETVYESLIGYWDAGVWDTSRWGI